jgi:hypothetical protein
MIGLINLIAQKMGAPRSNMENGMKEWEEIIDNMEDIGDNGILQRLQILVKFYSIFQMYLFLFIIIIFWLLQIPGKRFDREN